MMPNHVVAELADLAARHDATLVEDAKIAGNTPRKRQLLLDDQHRQPGLLVQADQQVTDLGDDVRLDAFAGFVEDQQARLQQQRATDCELLPSARNCPT